MVAAPRQSEVSLRRAAILLSNLDAESRRRLLSHLPNAQAASLRAAAASLVDVDPLEVRRVVDAFVGRVTIEQTKKPESRSVAEPQGGQESAEAASQHEQGESSGAGKVLQFLNQVSDPTLLHVVSSEHPQTVAIVLGALAPEQAAKLLRELPAEVRHAAIRRLGRLDEVPAEVLTEIAEHLRKVVGEIEPVSTGGGKKSLASILALLGHDERQALVGTAATSDHLVAAAMREVAAVKQLASVSDQHLDQHVDQGLDQSVGDRDYDVQSIPMRRSQAVAERNEQQTRESTQPTMLHDEFHGSEVMRHVDEILESLKPKELKALLAKLETRQAILTLCGLSPAQVKRLMKCLPRRQVRDVEQRMSGIGALELREIDAAKLAAVELLPGNRLGSIARGAISSRGMRLKAA